MAILRNKLRPTSAARRVELSAFVALAACLGFGQTKNSCLDCHSALPDPLGVSQEKFSEDVHAQKGLTCASCHGGDPTSDDPERAMSRKAGWKGKIDRKQIPQLCGSCHSIPHIFASSTQACGRTSWPNITPACTASAWRRGIRRLQCARTVIASTT